MGTGEEFIGINKVPPHEANADIHHAQEHKTDHENGGGDEISVVGLSGLLADQQTPLTHTTDKHTDLARLLWISALSFQIAGGALSRIGEYGTVQGTASQVVDVKCSISCPSDFVSFTSLQAVWLCTSGTGDMRWYLRTQYGEGGEVYSTHANNSGYGTTASGGTNYINVSTHPTTPITLPSLTTSDIIGINFYRDGSHASDTLDATMHFLGLKFNYVGYQ